MSSAVPSFRRCSTGATQTQRIQDSNLKIHDNGIHIGGGPDTISLGRDDSKYLARVLRSIHAAGKDATPSTVLTQRSPIVVTPAKPSGVVLRRGRTELTLSGEDCKWITRAFG